MDMKNNDSQLIRCSSSIRPRRENTYSSCECETKKWQFCGRRESNSHQTLHFDTIRMQCEIWREHIRRCCCCSSSPERQTVRKRDETPSRVTATFFFNSITSSLKLKISCFLFIYFLSTKLQQKYLQISVEFLFYRWNGEAAKKTKRKVQKFQSTKWYIRHTHVKLRRGKREKYTKLDY